MPEIIADVRSLTIRVGPTAQAEAPTTVVDDVSFAVGVGERWGLVGTSGAGKSLTAAAVAGLLPPGVRASGGVRVGGTELVGAGERVLAGVRGTDVALVAQDSAVALHPLHGVGAQLALPLRTHQGLGRRAARGRAVGLLAEVGLPAELAAARPAQLSGGQRQRVALAAALACRPRLLVADEPTAALDPTVARALLTRLDAALREHATALLLVTHDLGVLAAVCEHVLVLSGGRVVERGPVADVLAAPAHEVTRDLVDAARLSVPEVTA